MESIFEELQKNLKIKEQWKYKKYSEIYLRETSTEKQKNDAKELLFYIILDSFKAANLEVPEDALYVINKSEETLRNNKLDDASFIVFLGTVLGICKEANYREEHTDDSDEFDEIFIEDEIERAIEDNNLLDAVIGRLIVVANNVNDSTMINLLKSVNEKSSLEDKKKIVKSVLQEYNLLVVRTVRLYFDKKAVSIKANAELKALNGLLKECTNGYNRDSLLSNVEKFTDYGMNLMSRYSQDPEFKVSHESKGGTLIVPPKKDQNVKKYIIMGVAGLATVSVCIGAILGVHKLGHINNIDTDLDDDKTPEIPFEALDNAEMEKQIKEKAKIIFENWSEFNTEYTEENIIDMIKTLNDLPSNMDLETADDMLVTMINDASLPAFDRIVAGQTDVTNDKTLNVSDIMLTKGVGSDAVIKMENYFNAIITDPSRLEEAGTKALQDEILVLVENKEVDGLSKTSEYPLARILWSRIALGVNALTGTLGEDYLISVEIEPNHGVTCAQKVINDYVRFENQVERAMREYKTNIENSITFK